MVKKNGSEVLVKIGIISALLIVSGFFVFSMPSSFSLGTFKFDLSIIKLAFIVAMIGFIGSLIMLGLKYSSDNLNWRKNLQNLFDKTFNFALYSLAALILVNIYLWATVYVGPKIESASLGSIQAVIFFSLITITAVIFLIINDNLKEVGKK